MIYNTNKGIVIKNIDQLLVNILFMPTSGNPSTHFMGSDEGHRDVYLVNVDYVTGVRHLNHMSHKWTVDFTMQNDFTEQTISLNQV